MEHTLGAYLPCFVLNVTCCLNPCFNGTYSRSILTWINERTLEVLILVLMEHTLGENEVVVIKSCKMCLNPCFNGTYSRRRKRILFSMTL